jgi:hypothetical protein
MNLKQRIARLEQQGGVERRAAFLFIDIPGGKPPRLSYDDGTDEEWTGGEDYPPSVTVLGGIDPDIVLGLVILDGTQQVEVEGREWA